MNASTAATGTKRVVTRKELVNMIRFIDGAEEVEVEFTAVTDPRLRKTSKYDRTERNPYDGIMKMTVNRGYLNGRYIDAVNEQRIKEGKKNDFESKPLPWGDKEVSNGSIINHPNGPKLMVIKVENLATEYIHNSDIVTKEELEPFISDRKKSSRQGVEKDVVVRTFNVSSIRKIRVGANEFILKKD